MPAAACYWHCSAVATVGETGAIGRQPATQQGVAADADPVGRVKSWSIASCVCCWHSCIDMRCHAHVQRWVHSMLGIISIQSGCLTECESSIT
eukprot:jgi/Chrzof1/2047/UNPLg00704.t1